MIWAIYEPLTLRNHTIFLDAELPLDSVKFSFELKNWTFANQDNLIQVNFLFNLTHSRDNTRNNSRRKCDDGKNNNNDGIQTSDFIILDGEKQKIEILNNTENLFIFRFNSFKSFACYDPIFQLLLGAYQFSSEGGCDDGGGNFYFCFSLGLFLGGFLLVILVFILERRVFWMKRLVLGEEGFSVWKFRNDGNRIHIKQ